MTEYSIYHNYKELLIKALDEICELTESPVGFYHFVEPDQKTISLQAWSARTTREFCKTEGEGLHYDIDKAGIWVDCVRLKKAVIHNDYNSVPHRRGLPDGHAELTRELVVPIFRENKIVAILGVGNKGIDYSEEDEKTVTVLADMTWEIASRKIAEEKTVESEKSFRNLFSNMLEGFAYCQMIYEGEYPKDFRFLEVNKKFEILTGLKDVSGKLVTEVIPGIRTKDDMLFQIYSRVSLSGNPERFEIFVEALSDWYDISVYSPKKGFFIAVFDVVTKRKAIEEALKINETKFRSLFENSILGIYRTTPDGKILECNPALLEMLGYDSLEDLKNRNLEEYGYEPGHSRKVFKDKIEKDGEIKSLESAWIKKDGSIIYVNENARVIRDENNKIIFYEGTVEDITIRKKYEIELKKSENKYRRLHESLTDGFVLVNMDGIIIDFNDSYREMLGYSDVELKKLTFKDITPEKWHKIESELVQEQIFKKGYSDIYEKEYFRKNGEIFPVELRTFLLKNDKGESEGMWAIVRDITERKKADEELRMSEEKLRMVFDNSLIGKSITYPDGSLDVNNAFCDLLGYTKEELIEKKWTEITHPDDIIGNKNLVDSCLEGKRDSIKFEKRYIHKSGKTIHTLVSSVLQRDPTGKPLFFITAILDLTEIKDKEREQFRLLNILEKSLNEIYIFNSETLKFEYLNYGALKNIGYDMNELRNMTPLDIKPEFSLEAFKKMIEPLKTGEKELLTFETIHRRKNGTEYDVEVHLQLHKSENKNEFLAIINDITERKKAENELIESENKFRTLFESMNEGVALHKLIFDENGVAVDYLIVDVNTAFEKHTGFKSENARNQIASEFYGVKTFPPYFEIYKNVAVTGISNSFVSFFEPLNKHFEVSVFSPKKNYFATIFTDISERKAMLEALKESEYFFRESQNAASIGSYKQNLNTMIWESSEVLDRIFGIEKTYKKDTEGWLEIIHPDDRNMMGRYYSEEILSKHNDFNKEYRIIRKSDGKVRWVYGLGKIEIDEKNNNITMIGTIQDITERKIAEEKNAINNERTQALLQLNQMIDSDLRDITDYALEQAVKITQSKIGYLAFLNNDESILTMHSWSQNAMSECAIIDKPIIYPVETTGLWGEAVRQRKPVITNDYTADNPMKKGYPEGHVALKRHMNIPVFEGGKIVLLAGVGNKTGEYNDDDIQQLTLLMKGMWQLIERKRIGEEIKKLNEELELKVTERTKELENKNSELVRMNKLFVGRELRMVELKQKIKELEEKLKQ